MTPSQKLARKEQRVAEDALAAINADDGDDTIARIVADYLLTARRPPYCLSIFHDVRPRWQRQVEKLRKTWPDYSPADHIGPCLLPFDWRHKNTVGITTRDREHARQWTIDAMLAGYGVYRGFGGRGSAGFGQGSIAQIRARRSSHTTRAPHAGEAPKHL